ncbi:MAG: VIT and VWA domain-containing protein, partial [Planctomycetes bacterium]|nr:VIT and VWA domain-containing protein [Planctomycetota bacterium]
MEAIKRNSDGRRSQGAWLSGALFFCAVLFLAGPVFGAGLLVSKDSRDAPLGIRDHHVQATLHNGFAMTEVIQTFFNPNNHDLEAVYSFPLPESASLSEVTIYAGEQEIHGEVLPRERARSVYEEERDKGNETGLAEKNDFYGFEFFVYPVPAMGEVKIRFLYYQPLEIESGMGRYLYPLQEGGTDEAALDFWTVEEEVQQSFSIHVELKSSWPVTKVRAPGYEAEMKVEKKGEGHYLAEAALGKTTLNRDFVFYYRLAENLPGRLEVVPYRADPALPGTFMMIVTPGMDLQPLRAGADYTFVLDISGSMEGKIAVLAEGVVQALGEMGPQDRFRVITFNDRAMSLTRGWVQATQNNVEQCIRQVEGLRAQRGTNLYDGLCLALDDLDDDRANSIVLVTDAVTNTGVVDPQAFYQLMEKVDVRVFGFLLGNSGNWPLMRVVCEASGGTFNTVSNQDDLVGQILLAKNKIVFECLHNAELEISGVPVSDLSEQWIGKVYQGEQLVFFGRYARGGPARG